MPSKEPFSPKQVEFILDADARWNLAHGAVSTGKTICTEFKFFEMCTKCPDNDIAMIGKTSTTLLNNVIKLLFECEQLKVYRPFSTWSPSKRELKFMDKTITTYGAKDEGSTQLIQGRTLSLVYCDEMTLYPESFINMLDTRLRKDYSKGYAAMNPAQPTHILKQWIDKAEMGDPFYYELHFVLDDNPYLEEYYKDIIRSSSSGLFYKRNVLGLWCLAEGSVFDFFDEKTHVVKKEPRGAEYFVAGIDFGLNNAFACVLVGVSTGRYVQEGKKLWVHDEYFWDHKKKNRQKTVGELARDVAEFLEPYNVTNVYIDPSALPMKLEFKKYGIHTVDANNEVLDGIAMLTSEMSKDNLVVMDRCKNLIREIQTYVWDSKASEKGHDELVKKDDHAIDALRYIIASHKVPTYQPYAHNPNDYTQNRFGSRTF